MLSNSGSAASEPFGERHSLQLGALHTASPAGRRAEVASQFALYENSNGMISHRCDIRNIRSPLEKVLERGTFGKMTLWCPSLAWHKC